MSLYDYEASQRIALEDPPFYSPMVQRNGWM